MADSTSQVPAQGAQVRIQLTTRAPDIALPNEPEIVVSTGRHLIEICGGFPQG